MSNLPHVFDGAPPSHLRPLANPLLLLHIGYTSSSHRSSCRFPPGSGSCLELRPTVRANYRVCDTSPLGQRARAREYLRDAKLLPYVYSVPDSIPPRSGRHRPDTWMDPLWLAAADALGSTAARLLEALRPSRVCPPRLAWSAAAPPHAPLLEFGLPGEVRVPSHSFPTAVDTIRCKCTCRRNSG